MTTISYEPTSRKQFFGEAHPNRPLVLAPILSSQLFREVVQYPIIVEMWQKKRYGRVRKAYRATFTKAERRKLAWWHSKFWNWYICSGTPERVSLQPATIELLQRAVHFFATI